MPLKPIICLLCILFCDCLLQAQDKPTTDSLLRQLKSLEKSEAKLDTYLQLAKAYHRSDSTQSLHYLQKAFAMAQTLKSIEGIMKAFMLRGELAFEQGSFLSALHSYKLALEHAQIREDTLQQVNILNQLGRCVRNQGDFDKALAFFKRAVLLLEQNPDDYWLGYTYELIAGIYSRRGDFTKSEMLYEKAINYFKRSNHMNDYVLCQLNLAYGYNIQGNFYKALEVSLKTLAHADSLGDLRAKGVIIINLALVYGNIEEYFTSLKYANQAEQLFRELNVPTKRIQALRLIAYCYYKLGYNKKALEIATQGHKISHKIGFTWGLLLTKIEIGRILLAQKKYRAAQKELEKALQITQKLGTSSDQVEVLIHLGKTHYELKNYTQALTYLQESVDILPKIAQFNHYSLISNYLRDTYQALGMPQAALQASLMYRDVLDSLNLVQNTRKFVFLESQQAFKAQKDSLVLEQEREKFRYTAEIEHQRMDILRMFIGLVIALILCTITWIFYQDKLKANQKLGLLNKEIQAQNLKINEQNKDLERLVESKDRFYSIISHDLRGPVHSLSGLSSILHMSLEENNKEELKSFINLIEDSSKNISQLLDSLLTWAHQQQGLIQVKPEEIHLKALVEEVFALYHFQAKAKKIKLELTGSSGVLAWADPNGVLSILRNLLGNALKFSKEGGIVEINLSQSNNQALILVKDEGVGMGENQLQKLLNQDQIVSTTGTQGELGSGLGLLLVRDFVQMNQGSLEVKSSLGKGTCFKVSLPSLVKDKNYV